MLSVRSPPGFPSPFLTHAIFFAFLFSRLSPPILPWPFTPPKNPSRETVGFFLLPRFVSFNSACFFHPDQSFTLKLFFSPARPFAARISPFLPPLSPPTQMFLYCCRSLSRGGRHSVLPSTSCISSGLLSMTAVFQS